MRHSGSPWHTDARDHQSYDITVMAFDGEQALVV